MAAGLAIRSDSLKEADWSEDWRVLWYEVGHAEHLWAYGRNSDGFFTNPAWPPVYRTYFLNKKQIFINPF